MTRPDWNPAMPYGEHADNEAAWEKQAEAWGPTTKGTDMEVCTYCDRPTGAHSTGCPYAAQSKYIAGKSLAEWREFARRDDCLDRMVPSDLRCLLAEIPDH